MVSSTWAAMARLTMLLIATVLISHSEATETFNDVSGLIAAFGDYNSDKLTDVFVIKKSLQAFQVMRHFEKEPYLRRSAGCRFQDTNPKDIMALMPGDFRGNLVMDVVVVTKTKGDPNYNMTLINGNTNNFTCANTTTGLIDAVSSQPLMLDWNGDMISDLMADDSMGVRSVWLGTISGHFNKTTFLPTDVSSLNLNRIRDPNANAFIDLNQDGVADIFVDTEDKFEYWYADDSRQYGQNKPTMIDRPERQIQEKFELIGQSTFMDVNGDDKVEHLVPLCKADNCAIYALDLTIDKKTNEPLVQNWSSIATNFTLTINSTEMHMAFSEVKFGPKGREYTIPITLRHGDLNGDGYPDIVAIMATDKNVQNRIVLLENVADSNNFLGRSFKPFKSQPDITDPMLAAPFDLKEDSKLDILITTKPQSVNSTKLEIMAELNTQMFDANFIKVLVASGRCPDNECYKEGWIGDKQYKVNYGTNQPGPFVQYSLLDANGNQKRSCAGQLSQSGHFSLQVPYLILGLGSYANYVDKIIVTVPGGSKKVLRRHLIEQIVPDAQVIVIPHPMDDPSQWKAKLFLTPSEIIFKTLYTLLGICAGLLVVVVGLHKRELIEDEKDKEVFKEVWGR